MTPQDLVAHFDELAEAPGGVEHLRALVLRLAATGGLSAPEVGDGRASDCLLRAQEVRRQLIADGKIRNPRPLKIEDENLPPVEVPEAWTWARLDDVSAWPLTDGDWVESKDQDPLGDVRLVQLADVGIGEFKDKSDRHLTSATAIRLGCTFLGAGDILIARLPSPIGRACIFPGARGPCVTVVDVAIARLGGGINARYFTLAMNSDVLRTQVESYGKGATRFRVATGHLRQLWFPVPPLAEQKRIVARVDELMKLIDQLDAARTRREQARVAFRDSALSALQTATTTEEVDLAWVRVRERFDALLHCVGGASLVRQAVALLIATGRYSRSEPPEPADRPMVSPPQRRIGRAAQDASKAIEAAARIRGTWTLPTSWTWAALGDLATDGPTNGFSPPPTTTPTKYKSLTLSATTRGRFDPSCAKYVDVTDDIARDLILTSGDLLIQRSNTPEYVGMAAVFDGPEGQFIFPDLMMRLRFGPEVDVRWLHLVLNSGLGRGWFTSLAAGTSKSMVKVNQQTVGLTPIPLPPLVEQRRLVEQAARLDSLFVRTRSHEDAVAAAAAAFAAAAVHHFGA